MNLSIIGAGYVGLVTACCFAELGHKVKCIEKDSEKVKMLKKGSIPIYEPGLEEILKKNIGKNLFFTTSIADGVKESPVIFICVGTPQDRRGSADLFQVEEVAREIARNINGYKLIVEKSTVPLDSHIWINKTIQRFAKKGVTFDVASNPEFLKEGSAIEDFMKPDRIVIGVSSERAKKILLDLYSNFKCKKIVTNPQTSKLIKYSANIFLATKISFINNIADISEKVGADVNVVADAIGVDERIGRAFLNAGVGYGGSCLPKDVKAFIKIAESAGIDFKILKEIDRYNDERPLMIVKKVKEALWILKDKEIAIFGLSFKPNTDDIREAASLKIIPQLLAENARIRLYDPVAELQFRKIFPESEAVRYFKTPYEAVEGAHLLLILTEWEDFKKIDINKIAGLMVIPIVVDGRNIFPPAKMKKTGFEYYSIGRV